MIRHFTLLFGALAFLALAAHTASAVDYRPYLITDLGSLGTEGYSKGIGISESGKVAGYSKRDATIDWSDFAFYWSDGTIQDIGDTFGNTCTWSVADDIQDIDGDAVVIGHASQYGVKKLWTWNSTAGTYTLLGTADGLNAYAMNDSGVVVGQVTQGTTIVQQAFYHLGGTANSFVDIGTPTGYGYGESEAVDINNNGRIVGHGFKTPFAYNELSAFFYDINTGDRGSIIVPGWYASTAHAINDQGWMVLTLTASSATMTGDIYVWDGTTTHATGLSGAYDINNQGQVVGAVWGGGSSEGAHLYDVETGETTKLWDLLSEDAQQEWSKHGIGPAVAQSINEAGQITGYGYHTDYSQYVGFLMTPTLSGDANIDGSVNGTDLNAVLSNYNQTFTGDNKSRWMAGDFNCDGSVNGTDLNTVLSNYNQSVSFASTAAVPEPSTLLLMVLGLVGLWATRRVCACTHR